MLRTILAVLAGYVALFLVVMVSFTLLWAALGPEGAFVPGTTGVSGTWLAFSLPLGFLAAVLGGIVAVRVAGGPRARRRRALFGLVGVVLVLGVVDAIMRTASSPTAPADAPPPGELTAFEAANRAEQPTWVLWLLPFLGAAGVAAGGHVALDRGSPPREEPRPTPAADA